MTQERMNYVVIAIILIIIGFIAFPSLFPNAQDSENCTPSRFSSQWRNTDFCNISIDLSEIISGGPPKDGIRAVDNPLMDTVQQASTWLIDRSPVIAVEIDGEARAYPQAILMAHEITNDEVAGIPVAVTFCPLCNSSIVFDRRVGEDTLVFGVSGVLRNSDMVMFDRQTDSWWQQLTGEGIVGHYTETVLDVIPSQVIGFGQFAERYPDGLVMSPETGLRSSYGSNFYPGVVDDANPVIGLFRGEYDTRLPNREHVLAVEYDGNFMAYPFSILSETYVINDTISNTSVVAFWQPGVASALDQAQIDASRDIGTAALFERTLDDGTILTFSWNTETATLTDNETGSTWNLFGEAIEGQLAGTELKQVVAAPHFWFAWAAFHPETEIYGIE